MRSSLAEILARGRQVETRRGWSRVIVSPEIWGVATGLLVEGRSILLGLWAEGDAVHMALLCEEPLDIAVVTLPCVNRRFPSVGGTHPPAMRFERTIRDLYGLEPVSLPDQRPWLDHGRWDLRHPLGKRRKAPAAPVP